MEALAPFATDPRLRYARSTGAPSMTENWNLAFERVRGDYAIVLGDDDAVGDEIVNAARWARDNDVDAIADERLSYLWPNYQLREAAGTIRVGRHTGVVTYVDAPRSLEQTLRKYPIDTTQLPHIYHGLVRMSLMREIKARAGMFFDSMAPDFYSTIALSCIARRFARAAYPLCASGASAAANAGRVHEGKDHLHALEYKRAQWSPYVPPFYTMGTSILDATIKALIHMDRRDLIPVLDFSSFYADCFVQHTRSATAILREIRRLGSEHPSLPRVIRAKLVPRIIQMTGHRLRQFAGRQTAARGLKRLKSRIRRVDYDVMAASDIVEALQRAQQLMDSRGVKSPFTPSEPSPPTA
jgi:hypothetical protein